MHDAMCIYFNISMINLLYLNYIFYSILGERVRSPPVPRPLCPELEGEEARLRLPAGEQEGGGQDSRQGRQCRPTTNLDLRETQKLKADDEKPIMRPL